MNINKWISKNTSSLKGKTVVISGSTGGLGRELCFYLASLGASLILLDRNMVKSQSLADELRLKHPDIPITHIQADMSVIQSVKDALDRLLKMDIDYLILNAGAYSIPRYTADTGYGNVFEINFISPYHIATELLPQIRARGGRVIFVSSIAHNYSKIDVRDIDFATRTASSKVYGNAKRYLTYSLLAKSEGDVIAAHPGITFTGITAHYPKLIFAIIKHPMKIIFMPPRVASLCVLYALFAECDKHSWIGPRFFDVWGSPRVKPLRTAKREEIEKIVSIAEKINQSL